MGGNLVMSMEPSLSGISALIKETPESSLELFPPCEHTTGSRQSARQKRALRRTLPGWRPGLGISAPRTVRDRSLLFMSHPIYAIFVTAARTNQDIGALIFFPGHLRAKVHPPPAPTPVVLPRGICSYSRTVASGRKSTDSWVTQLSSLRPWLGLVFPGD